jgi:hypothetical protein
MNGVKTDERGIDKDNRGRDGTLGDWFQPDSNYPFTL